MRAEYGLPQKTKVLRLVEVMMSIAPLPLRSATVTMEPTPERLWISSYTNRSSWRARIPNRVANIQHRGAPRIGVDDIVFRGETLSGNEIGNAVSIHIGASGAVELSECDQELMGALRSCVGEFERHPVRQSLPN